VREKTIARVEAAVARLGYRADPAAARLARNQSFRFAFILPTGSNSFMANLTEQVQRSADWLAGQRAHCGRHRRIVVAARPCRAPIRIPQILSSEYPDLTALPALQGRDDSECTRVLTAELLKRHPDLLGIYSVGAGNRGIAAALEEARKARDIVWIADELTHHTRRFLLHGTIDAIINQDPATRPARRRGSCSRIAGPSRSFSIRNVSASTYFSGIICLSS
jgi:hypothetical protein